MLKSDGESLKCSDWRKEEGLWASARSRLAVCGTDRGFRDKKNPESSEREGLFFKCCGSEDGRRESGSILWWFLAHEASSTLLVNKSPHYMSVYWP